ncbi:Na+(H+)/acetate symporter ActP [Microbacterium ginsengiterrae]|uniref:Na+(H+)/acetate symporter ActP n=1 Tax=Microbacterium ginsengiterrae TaxID=546115 RepID=A0A7W9CCG2_9MICO|nr:cation acetate symporter [Microbacterium ginsengiterrae]MBB5743060.1 Na+(H+)/acetate symporter ActP [Microbacterium ginsengiterrae]
MNPIFDLIGVGLVIVATLLIGVYGLRVSRTTSDFFVASRTVRPVWNASAISGEYLSAGTFLGLSGLVLLEGARGFWFPIGYAAGYLLVLVFVAAPLRRSGAYTIPDFIEARLESVRARRVTSAAVLIIGWLYIVPQLHGAGLTLSVVAGLPEWVGEVAVAVLVAGSVAAGGMRAITYVQAFQYWLKLFALLVPLVCIVFALTGGPRDVDPVLIFPAEAGPAGFELYETMSLMLALVLGTMGLPHVLVRFYTSPTGVSARQTTVLVIVMVSAFYAVSSGMGLVSRIVAPDLADPAVADTAALVLPARVFPGLFGELLTALVVAGAFAAFLATSAGLIVSLAGVISQDVFSGSVRAFRLSAVLCAAVPLAVALLTSPAGLGSSVGMVFVFAASMLSPVVLLGVWWAGLTARGAVAGMVTGGLAPALALLVHTAVGGVGAAAPFLAQPAAWTIPLATAVTVGVSLLGGGAAPSRADRFLARLHTPERAEGRPPGRSSGADPAEHRPSSGE